MARMTTTIQDRCNRQVRYIIDQIINGERDYAQATLPGQKRATFTVRRGFRLRDGDMGMPDERDGTRLLIVDRSGEPTAYDANDPGQLELAVERIDVLMARGGHVDLGNWVHSTTPPRLALDASRR